MLPVCGIFQDSSKYYAKQTEIPNFLFYLPGTWTFAGNCKKMWNKKSPSVSFHDFKHRRPHIYGHMNMVTCLKGFVPGFVTIQDQDFKKTAGKI